MAVGLAMASSSCGVGGIWKLSAPVGWRGEGRIVFGEAEAVTWYLTRDVLGLEVEGETADSVVMGDEPRRRWHHARSRRLQRSRAPPPAAPPVISLVEKGETGEVSAEEEEEEVASATADAWSANGRGESGIGEKGAADGGEDGGASGGQPGGSGGGEGGGA